MKTKYFKSSHGRVRENEGGIQCEISRILTNAATNVNL